MEHGQTNKCTLFVTESQTGHFLPTIDISSQQPEETTEHGFSSAEMQGPASKKTR
jgi:hypothetical protein